MNEKRSLTDEQVAVVNHPRGNHARVLAVAGSGKTTTMACRVKRLVKKDNVSPNNICILMFNRLARVDFSKKLHEIGLSENEMPDVNTFHSYSYGLISKAVEKGWIKGLLQMWINDLEERVRITALRATRNVADQFGLDTEVPEIDEVLEAIGLWKGSLIPPERAGYRGHHAVPLIYKEFEKLRSEANGVTFDDFVPLAVEILERDRQTSRDFENRYDYLIVDEYQDVNLGQQRLIQLIAGTRADVMVVGDDDQTIYEWRGARPDYILNFSSIFSGKPSNNYTLSRSFRFGPVIAQCAQNVIGYNSDRMQKPIIASKVDAPSQMIVTRYELDQVYDVSKELTEQIIQIVKKTGEANRVVVLARMYSQLSSLEIAFLTRGVPYRVEGRVPFFKRREIQAILDYLSLAISLDDPISQIQENKILLIANMPNRKISKKILTTSIRKHHDSKRSTRLVISALIDIDSSPFSKSQRQSLGELLNVLERLNEIICSPKNPNAFIAIKWLLENVNFPEHFSNYFGNGEASEDRNRAVTGLLEFSRQVAKNTPDFLAHIERLDTTHGVALDDQIVMTTVFRTKGLEFDYVFIPNCEEGYMPCLKGGLVLVYDLKGTGNEPQASEVIKNERRLFYVAITRAKKAVFIGAPNLDYGDSQKTISSARSSRFLTESEHDASSAVMTSVQELASENSNARKTLIDMVILHAASKRVMDGLIQNYLPLLGDPDLLNEVSGIVNGIPAQIHSPQPIEEETYHATKKSMPSVPRWWESKEF